MLQKTVVLPLMHTAGFCNSSEKLHWDWMRFFLTISLKLPRKSLGSNLIQRLAQMISLKFAASSKKLLKKNWDRNFLKILGNNSNLLSKLFFVLGRENAPSTIAGNLRSLRKWLMGLRLVLLLW